QGDIIYSFNESRDSPVSGTPDGFINLYSDCWDTSPDKRPTCREAHERLRQLFTLDSSTVNDDQRFLSDQIMIVNEEQQPDTLYDSVKLETINPPTGRIQMSDHQLIDELLRTFESGLGKSTLAAIPASHIKKWIKQMNYKEEEVLHVLTCNQDYKDSLLLIGLFHMQKIGTEFDWVIAYDRFLESFNKGKHKAAYWHGLCYESGFGKVAANSKTALT
ncbi:2935_t:CDS:1, partial [Paraglomus occultum]